MVDLSPPIYAQSTTEALKDLESDAVSGLSPEDVSRRKDRYGPNIIQTDERTRWYQIFGRQFVDFLVFILLGAAVVSVLVGEMADAIAIGIIIVLNGVLGFMQEWRAEKALSALQKLLSPATTVIRGGQRQTIASEELVPGDLVVLATGDRIPADLRLLESTNLMADESLLTGESEAVSKQTGAVAADAPISSRLNMLWMGTTLTHGRARGVVAATGGHTEFGRIAALTQGISREATPLQKRLASLGKYLGLFAVLLSVAIALLGSLTGKDWFEMFMTGISLAVAVVPEGLPAVVTVTLALGIRAMVRRKALLRRLQAAETLGAATVICTDKTGTLTQNEMTVKRLSLAGLSLSVTGVGYGPAGDILTGDGQKLDQSSYPPALKALLATAAKCNNARIEKGPEGWQRHGAPTEAALISLAMKGGQSLEGFTLRREFSFDSERKRMSVLEEHADGPSPFTLHTKGAPEVLLPLCTHIFDGPEPRALRDADIQALSAAQDKMSAEGLRTLALAQKPMASDCRVADCESGLVFLGLVGIEDPPRPEVPEAIALAKQAGMKVIMITGDAIGTAAAIATQIGLPIGQKLTGQDVDSLSDEALAEALQGEVLFARTAPEHKLRIVKILKERGEIAAMTGDGVNDAPALRQADIGIAMGMRGTDVAKGASDIVLTDDNFASIINAVEEGRRQYENIRKFVRYLLTSNTGEVIAVLSNIILGGPLILLPIQILWINLVTDSLSAIALGLEPSEKGAMSVPPRDPKESLVDQKGTFTILGIGTYIGVAALFLFHSFQQKADLITAQTVAFSFMVVAEKLNVFNFRSLSQPLHRIGLGSNPWLLVAVAGTLAVHITAVSHPLTQSWLKATSLDLATWLTILLWALPVFIIPELWKTIQRAKKG